MAKCLFCAIRPTALDAPFAIRLPLPWQASGTPVCRNQAIKCWEKIHESAHKILKTRLKDLRIDINCIQEAKIKEWETPMVQIVEYFVLLIKYFVNYNI